MVERLVLSFHGLGSVPDGVVADERPYWCDEDVFVAILDAIPAVSKAAGILIEITFDDGNASDALIATPALADRGLHASFFVCAGRIGSPGYLDAAAMAEMRSAGMQIGSHGWGHVDWRKADDQTLTREIETARQTIADAIGDAVEEVAIPFGSYDRRVIGRSAQERPHDRLHERRRASSAGRVVGPTAGLHGLVGRRFARGLRHRARGDHRVGQAQHRAPAQAPALTR